MRRIIFLVFLSFYCSFSFAQNFNNVKYIGVIRVNDIGSFAYEINITVNDNKITGTTITTTGNNNETKANLSGEVSKNGSLFKFSEHKIIETDIKNKKTTFCFVNAVLNKKTKGKIDVLDGKFIGKDEKGEVCATGKIYLVRKSAIMADSVNMTQFIKKISDTLENIKKSQNRITELSITEVNKIICVGKKVRIRFYDGNIDDNDEIDIVYHDKSIVEKYVINRTGRTFNFTIEDGKENLIIVNTHNTGYSGLNTVNIDVEISPYQIKTYRFEASARKSIKIKLVN